MIKKTLLVCAVVLVPAVAWAGAVGGAKHKRDTVLAGQSDLFTIVFEGEEPARINVTGDHSSDLDCYVYDNKNNLVASDDDATDACNLRWTPSWTGKFKLKITNRGSSANEYVVQTN